MEKYERFKELINELRKLTNDNFRALHVVVEDLNVQDGFINTALYQDIDKYSQSEKETAISKEIATLLLNEKYEVRKRWLYKYWNIK